FEVSANSEKALYRQGTNWFIASTATLGQPAPPSAAGAPGAPNLLKTADMEVYVDPRAEWQQMYREAWRVERDFFYDPGYHGLDLEATASKYSRYVDSLAHRADLNYLFQEIFGELTVGHLYVSGGDVPNPNRVAGGLLGCDYAIENGRYRFAKIYDGENWNPQLRAPLTQPGINVQEGEYLLAISGRNLTASDNVYAFLENNAGKQVVIRVGPNADGSLSREVTVVPVASEAGLRNLAWVEDNRRKVEKLSNGKLAYVWLPDTAGGGYTFFNRYYFSQLDKDGAVIDERFNSGGQAADYVIAFRHDARSEGDARQRVCRLGRGLPAIHVPPVADWPAHRQAHMGRTGGNRWHAAVDGWGRDHRAELRVLHAGRQVGDRKSRRRAGHRGRDGPVGVARRSRPSA
ncbi:MAG: hypothetical protein DMF70_14510, partial [Acidobacteria bacterium]